MESDKPLEILGVRVDNLSRREIRERVLGFLREDRFHQITTVNPEFILEAQDNSEFKNILNSCDLNIADGFGIRCAFWRFGRHLKTRLAGADLLQEILKVAERKNLKIFLAINKDGLSSFEEIKGAILKKHPRLDLSGEDLDVSNTKCQIPASPAGRLNTDYQILFCNFGAPHQEVFINSQKYAKIRLAMGVGGSFDYFTRKARRAPVLVRQIGLEWLWRACQPQSWRYKRQRLKRVWRATVVFPWRVIINR